MLPFILQDWAPSGFYDDDIEFAQEMVNEFGRTVQFIRLNRTFDDPLYPQEGTSDARAVPDETLTTKMAFLEPATEEKFGRMAITEDMIKNVDMVGFVAPGGDRDLEEFDEVLDFASYYKIDWMRTFAPGDAVIFVVMGLKR